MHGNLRKVSKRSFSLLERYPQGTSFSSTLKNGIQVWSGPVDGGATVGLGIFLRYGSINEEFGEKGASNILGKIGLSSTTSRDKKRMLEDISSIVGSVQLINEREFTMYNAMVLPDHTEKTFELLSDAVQNLSIEQDDVDQAMHSIEFQVEQMKNDFIKFIPEFSHVTAFGGKGLGNSIVTLPGMKIKVEKVIEFHKKNLSPENILVVGAGINHDEIVRLTEKYFGSLLPNGKPSVAPESVYFGGQGLFREDSSKLTFGSLAFKLLPVTDQKSMYAMAVVNQMLGGGSSFSSGGPGKGMFSRLYNNVLYRHRWLDAAQSVAFPYRDCSLFVLYGCSFDPRTIGQIYKVLAQQFMEIFERVDDIELQRTKNMMRSNILMNLESRSLQVEDIGRNVMAINERPLAKNVIENINSVTVADMKMVVDRTFCSPVTVTAYGPLKEMPDLDAIRRLGMRITDSIK